MEKKIKYVAYGDSITQGYTSLSPSLTYVNLVGMELDADVYDLGIGGEFFQPMMMDEAYPVQADIVTVAYGTNDWKHCTKEEFDENCTSVLQKLTDFYPDKPIFVITPSWRSDYNVETPFGAPATEIYAQILKNAEHFPNVTVIRGWDLIPHNTDFFGDNRLHPNNLGFDIYAANIYRKIIPHLIKKIGYSFD